MHNDRTADPLDDYTKAIKAISKKRTKTEEDYLEMARLEFLAGLYLMADGNGGFRPCIPSENLEGMIFGKNGAAKRERRGNDAKIAIRFPGPFTLEYDGPTDPEKLWDAGFWRRDKVRVQSSSVMRTRPEFKDWSAEVAVIFNPEIVDKADIMRWMEVGGAYVGLMDWRPQKGTFTVERLD